MRIRQSFYNRARESQKSAIHWKFLINETAVERRCFEKATPPHSGLLNRLAALQHSSGAGVLLVAFYDRTVWESPGIAAERRRITRRVLDAAIRQGMGAVDSFPVLAGAPDPRTL